MQKRFSIRKDVKATAILCQCFIVIMLFFSCSVNNAWCGDQVSQPALINVAPTPYRTVGEITIAGVVLMAVIIFLMASWRHHSILTVNQKLTDNILELQKAQGLLAAKEKTLNDITSSLLEGIYVSDEHGNILFMNPEAERLLGWTMMDLINKHVHEVFHYRKADGSSLSFEECNIDKVIRTGVPFVSRDEVFVRKDGAPFPISLVSSPIMENGRVVAAVTAFRDITERKQIERQREKLISELQEAVAKVKQLSGLLPICACCKKIRDDKGYWKQIETYISEHSEALFSHAICPECGKKMYPEYYDQVWGKEEG